MEAVKALASGRFEQQADGYSASWEQDGLIGVQQHVGKFDAESGSVFQSFGEKTVWIWRLADDGYSFVGVQQIERISIGRDDLSIQFDASNGLQIAHHGRISKVSFCAVGWTKGCVSSLDLAMSKTQNQVGETG